MSLHSDLLEKIIAFRDERDWQQFHNPKDLAAGLAIEAAELQELFLWKTSKCLPIPPHWHSFAPWTGRAINLYRCSLSKPAIIAVTMSGSTDLPNMQLCAAQVCDKVLKPAD